MDNQELVQRGEEVFIKTYSRFSAPMCKGKGCLLYDAEGEEYLDFLAGVAVCSLGHCHNAVTRAICRQAEELVHVSNLFHVPSQVRLAELLVDNSFADKVFMANSGAEANEAAIKLARIHSGEDRYEIISLQGSFHGRTLATLAATGQPQFREGFEPVPDGFVHAKFAELEEINRLINDKTCAIICEPLQGESGVRPLAKKYLQGLRSLCDKHNLLLIFDEIQTGMGRTGTLFAHEQLGVVPDIMTLAKALGNGMPIGAMLATDKVAASFAPGSHGSTFGGNPVAAAAAVAVFETMLEPGFFPVVREKSEYFFSRLDELVDKYPRLLASSRGMGMLLALVLTEEGRKHGADIVKRMFEQKVLINFAGSRVLRFLPPLIVSKEEIDLMIERLDKVLAGLNL